LIKAKSAALAQKRKSLDKAIPPHIKYKKNALPITE